LILSDMSAAASGGIHSLDALQGVAAQMVLALLGIRHEKSASRPVTTSEVDSRARRDRVRQPNGAGFAERSRMIMIVNIARTVPPLGG